MQRTVKIASSLASRVTLNDGVQMPMFGLGVFNIKGEGATEAVCKHALQTGYRLLDTAEIYGNEVEVGNAVNTCGVPREEIFVTTKVYKNGAQSTEKAVTESLKKMKLDYIDLYLIHSPRGGDIVESYDVLLYFKKKGLIRSVGVSNFNHHHLLGLQKAKRPKPSVNQIELHPWQQSDNLVKYCDKEGITVVGHTPLFRGGRMGDPDILRMARKYLKTPAQVLIRWGVQHGFIMIPSSSKPERLSENAQVFDWSIDDEDMKKMRTYPEFMCGAYILDTPWMN